MKSVKEMRKELSSLYAKVLSGDVDKKTADSLTNIAGKMINSVKLELEYASLKKTDPNIQFLND